MGELIIYDSHGEGVRDDTGDRSQRIEDFFFSQVRLAIDRSGMEHEIVCFFRARESSATRSEQYYAVFRSNNSWTQAKKEFQDALEQRVEREYGLSFVTTTDDTDAFEYIYGDESPSGNLSEKEKIDDVIAMLGSDSTGSLGGSTKVGDELDSTYSSDISGSSYGGRNNSYSSTQSRGSGSIKSHVQTPSLRQARIGVGTYQTAFNVAAHIATDVQSFAIVENTAENALDTYDVVIEKGSYAGIQLLGETKEKYQTYQDRIEVERQRRKKTLADSDSGSRLFTKTKIAGGVIFLVVAAVAGVYAACLFGVPVHDAVPGCGEEVGVEIDSLQMNGDDSIDVELTLLEDGEAISEDANITLWAVQSTPGNVTTAQSDRVELVTDIPVAANDTTVRISREKITSGIRETEQIEDVDQLLEEYEAIIGYEGEKSEPHAIERVDVRLELDSARWTEDGELDASGVVEAGHVTNATLILTASQDDRVIASDIQENVSLGPDGAFEISELGFDDVAEVNETEPGTLAVEYVTASSTIPIEPIERKADSAQAVEYEITYEANWTESADGLELEVVGTVTADDEGVGEEQVTITVTDISSEEWGVTTTTAGDGSFGVVIPESQLVDAGLDVRNPLRINVTHLGSGETVDERFDEYPESDGEQTSEDEESSGEEESSEDEETSEDDETPNDE